MGISLRDKLVSVALEWQSKFGIAPHITAAIAEYDAAMLVQCSENEYCQQMQTRTAVGKGYDFIFKGDRYQVKANRPSGKPGSPVTLVPKAKNYEWDYLIWVLYDTNYRIQEAWVWPVSAYKLAFENRSRLSPSDMRQGKSLYAKK